MKISLNWLQRFVEIPNIDPSELGQLFTIRTAEVEGVMNEGEAWKHIVAGQIKSIQPHPNADKLRVTQTDVGTENGGTLQIVCGAPNITEGMWVIIALPGSKVRWHGEGDLITLEKASLRGMESNGMICGGDEVGLETEITDGVLDLKVYKPTSKLPLKAGQNIATLLGKSDVILEIDNKSLTHRPDCWGHYGIAREMAAIFDTKLKPYEKAVKILKDTEIPTHKSPLEITVHDKEICPRFTSLTIKNIQVKESPDWLKRDLIAVGVRPVNNIVDITNYVMYELGQPMHAYDRKVVGTDKLEIRYAHKGEKLETIDHKSHDLTTEDPVITNGTHVLTLAGVMGGTQSEINKETTEIILESANWQPGIVRKASQRHGLRTDAVQRYEKSLDSEMTMPALLRAAALIKKLCPKAELEGGIVDIYSTKLPTKVITVNPEKIAAKIGVEISLADMKSILQKLQFSVKVLSGKPKLLEVTVPSFRATKDINNEDDILEEVARAHGYEKIAPTLPSLPINLPRENEQRKLEHKSRDILSLKLGLSEVYNYSFYGKEDLQKCDLPEDIHLKLENYLSSEQTHLRTSLVPNLLKNLISNLRFKKEMAIYEIGRTYNEEQEFFPREEIIITGAIISSKYPSTFLAAKGIVETYCNSLNVTTQEWKKGITFCPTAHPNRYAELATAAEDLSNEPSFARIYELHPEVASANDLPSNIAIFEINLTKLLKESLGIKDAKYKAIPKFPGIELDIAVLIDKKVTAGELEKAIKHTNLQLIKRAYLFDQYEGDKIEADKKSLAFNILLQAEDRTLTDEDMVTAQKAITAKIESMGGVIR
ncbi:MAG: phenylalanine--tRNA ligase subunit beta [Candidatus Gracilibacteria bacterium]